MGGGGARDLCLQGAALVCGPCCVFSQAHSVTGLIGSLRICTRFVLSR